MSLAAVFDKLGQSIIPTIASKVFPDLLDVVEQSTTSDGAGGRIKATEIIYPSIPCAYEPNSRNEYRTTRGDRMASVQEYLVTFPTHDDVQDRLNIDPAIHRLSVQARGNEPAKTFRIIALRDDAGVVFEAICERQNDE